MNKKACMPISEFARLTGIRKENLRFYDQIGLLSPEFRADNNYRYYTRQQLSTAYLIGALRELNVSLDDIKQYIGNRTPQRMLDLFAEQDKHICRELDRLDSMREVMKLYADMAEQAIDCEGNIIIVDRECEPIFLTPKVNGALSVDDEVIRAYEYAEQYGLSLGYPLGAILHRAKSKQLQVQRYYFNTVRKSNSCKPAGQYAIAYGRCRLGESAIVYQQLNDFIKDHNLQMCSDIYEEYPFNQLSIDGDELYCARLEVLVKNK